MGFFYRLAQIYSVCIGLIKMIHPRTYMKWFSYGYGCSHHETLSKFREIAAATHREALMVSIAILSWAQPPKYIKGKVKKDGIVRTLFQ